jgi:homoserine O-succinyltransferase
MPIKIPDNLPAADILRREGIFIMGEHRACHQDIRPLRLAILNLMPNKEATEAQILRLIGNTPLQIDITLLHMGSRKSTHTSEEYLSSFYHVFGKVKHTRFDGMIITGAPVEHLDFKEVTYWPELVTIMDYTSVNVTSTVHICWSAQAGLYHHYGVQKYPLKEKKFGIFAHRATARSDLLRGMDDVFYAPHSRHTEIRAEDLLAINDLQILAESEEAGLYMAATKDNKRIFITGHAEYDPDTLHDEYLRDLAKGDKISAPVGYFKNDDPNLPPVVTWRSHASLLFSNWINIVYQETPYDWC